MTRQACRLLWAANRWTCPRSKRVQCRCSSSVPALWDQELKQLEPFSTNPVLFYAHGPGGGDVVVLRNDVSFERGGKTLTATISVGADQAEYEKATLEFRDELIRILGLTGVFLALASALQNFVGLQPLVRVRKAVSAVRHGTSSSIDDHGPVEVRPLIAEINTLLLAERSAVERARARASDLASGLKTPVTILSQIGETVEKSGDPEQANRIRDQVEAIRSRTYRQLALARSSVSGAMQLDAATLTAKLADVVASVAATRKVRLENRIEAGTMIRADATDYAEALGNLIDNAIAHAKSKVVISAAAYGKFVRIKVANDGSGIDAKDRVTALARGQRLDESGNGFGLGLAITTDIMRAYGGSISLDTSPMDGLAVHLDWPKNQV